MSLKKPLTVTLGPIIKKDNEVRRNAPIFQNASKRFDRVAHNVVLKVETIN